MKNNSPQTHISRRGFLSLAAIAGLTSGTIAQTEPRPITPKIIRDALRGKQLSSADSKGRLKAFWEFSREELIEVDILNTEKSGSRTTALVDIRTGSHAQEVRSRFKVNGPCVEKSAAEVEGRIRMHFMNSNSDYIIDEIENVSARLKWVR